MPAHFMCAFLWRLLPARGMALLSGVRPKYSLSTRSLTRILDSLSTLHRPSHSRPSPSILVLSSRLA
eukprot:scaffold116423_cov29-Tisochrysis_lutea.AAC.2